MDAVEIFCDRDAASGKISVTVRIAVPNAVPDISQEPDGEANIIASIRYGG